MFKRAKIKKELAVILRSRATAVLLSFAILLAAFAPVIPTFANVII